MINYKVNENAFLKDLVDEINLFATFTKRQFEVEQFLTCEQNSVVSKITINKKTYFDKSTIEAENEIEFKRKYKRFAKNVLFKALKRHINAILPWGSLTGVKPVRLFYDLIMSENMQPEKLYQTLKKDFCVSSKKINLALKILDNQPEFIQDNERVCLYVNLPFCPERCSYCSFISKTCKENDAILDEYVETLIKEIVSCKNILKNKTIESVYVGGGTPSILNTTQIEKLLKSLSFIKCDEFTFECGRADTITKEKLEVLKRFGVNRICINPQTTNEKVLCDINRHITNAQFETAMKLAKSFDFIINCDLIAGLKGESFSSFKTSVSDVLSFEPDNISVHSLALKRKSNLAKIEESDNGGKIVSKMIEYAIKKLDKNFYEPYYLYRLKNTYQGLENIGFSKKDKVCKFNICSMDEKLSIVACGANAISKKIDFKNNKIDREDNQKDISTYIEKIDTQIEKKIKFFK